MPDPVHCTPNHVLEVLKDTESDHLILAHMGGWRLWNEVKEKLMEKPLYFDTSFSGDYLQKEGVSGMLTKEAFVDLIHAMGSDRVRNGQSVEWAKRCGAVVYGNRFNRDRKKEDFI